MELKTRVRMSVHALVETTLHESDLSPASGTAQRMREGAAAHRARQSGQRVQDEAYRAEMALCADYESETLILHVAGRADGVCIAADGAVVIEEIKLGATGMALLPAHWAQVQVYGHMLCAAQGVEQISLCVLYVDVNGQPLERYERQQTARELREAFDALCVPAAAWAEKQMARRRRRDASLQNLSFPFPAYREGQRRFAQNVYVAIRDRKRLFAQAPTGIGKTMAALYPALVAIGQGCCARAVFLTARTTGRRSALDAMQRLAEAGARVLAVEIAAKDKVCAQEVRDCRPESCPYAEGFYDRLPASLGEAITCADGLFSRERIAQLAAKHALCPFELSLELARLADVVIGDYNYVYDPFVAIDALLAAPGGAALLVDEAHQLGSRVRDAYSGGVGVDELRSIRREVGRVYSRKCELYQSLTDAIRALKALAQESEFAEGRLSAVPRALCDEIERVQQAAIEQLSAQGSGCAADALRLSMDFLLAAKRFDGRYAALTAGNERHASVLLQCLDASPEILETSRRARGVVYFSATVAPFAAAQRTLGSEEGDACLLLPTPFDPAHIRVRVEPIDIRYARREESAPQVAQAIARHLRENAGHTLVFFPSYAYLERIYELVLGEDDLMGTSFAKEARGLAEEEKNALLGAFDGENPERIALFAVLGGAFSEGIDLPGKRLQNVIVVSTGMPQPDAQVRAMQAYYDAQGEDGFLMAMTLPGMVRVIQAAGRLIRTQADTGSLLLVDSRFMHKGVRALMRGTLVGAALGE